MKQQVCKEIPTGIRRVLVTWTGWSAEGGTDGNSRRVRARRHAATRIGLLPLERFRRLPARRGVPGSGSAATAEPWDVQALSRRARGATRPRRTIWDHNDANPCRRRGEHGARKARASARLSRDRVFPRTLAELIAAAARTSRAAVSTR